MDIALNRQNKLKFYKSYHGKKKQFKPEKRCFIAEDRAARDFGDHLHCP